MEKSKSINKNNRNNSIRNNNINLRYKTTISQVKIDPLEINNSFDPYSLQNYPNKIYLSSINKFSPNKIDIISLTKSSNYQKILSLTKHQKFVVCCKYFKNNFNYQREFLISVDDDRLFIIWLIISEKKYDFYKKIINKEERFRIPFTMIFDINNYNEEYIVYSLFNNKVYLYSLVKNLTVNNFQNVGKIYQYITWINSKEKNKNYLIQSNENEILIYDILIEKNFKNIKRIKTDSIKGKNESCCIIYGKNNTDYLCILNQNKFIVIYDLFLENFHSVINCGNKNSFQICSVKNNFLITLNEKDGDILIIDFESKKILTRIKMEKLKGCNTIKVIENQYLGHFLLVGGLIQGVSLFKNIGKEILDVDCFFNS